MAGVLKVTAYLHLVRSLRLYGVIPLVPHMSLWHGALSTGATLPLWFLIQGLSFIAALYTLALLYRKLHLLGYPMRSAMFRTVMKEM
jgi:hypothetical protein